jgi:hypothetical protein
MYGVMLAYANALQPPSFARTVRIFSLLGITTILSWPFTGLLAIVFVLHDFAQMGLNGYHLKSRVIALITATAMVSVVLVTSSFNSNNLVHYGGR